MTRDRRIPGYMVEDLELRIVGGPPRYARDTDKAVEHITLRRAGGELMGYIYGNDEDDAAGWVAQAGASPEAWNDAAFWIRMLQDAKARGLKPSEALNELLQAANPASQIVPGSRATSANLDALRALAGV
jgi:hypothetical protein